MAIRLPSNLGPRAKKRLVTAAGDEVDAVLVQVGPSADVVHVRRWVQETGGVVRSWSDETRLLGIELASRRLGELAALDGVVYVEVGGRFGP